MTTTEDKTLQQFKIDKVSEQALLDTSQKSQFDTIRQGKATNQLTKVSDKGRNTRVNDITKEAKIEQGEITVFIDKYTEATSKLSPTTYRLLDALTVKFTDTGASNTLIQLPLNEYMDRCGLKDVKTARKQVKDELDRLYALSITWSDKVNGKQADFVKVRIKDTLEYDLLGELI